MKTYLFVYIGSAVLATIITPVIIHITNKFKIFDPPNMRKIHARPTPRIGGVAIFISMMSLVLPVLFLPNIIGESFRLVSSKIVILLFAAGLMFLIGLIDDIRTMRARHKLLFQFLAAIIICSAGIRINHISLTDSLIINFGPLSWPVTIFWIIGITNAVNLIDGLDGLAAGICAAACGVIAILAVYFGQSVMAILMLALLGSLSGFLLFNFNPAKIFMGDSGSLFLGFIIASSSILCAAKTQTIVGLALPALALGIPIFDTLLSILRRFLERRSIFAPDRRHFHHRLLAIGFRHRHAVIVAYLVTLLASGLGFFMLFTGTVQTLIVFACTLFLLVTIFRMVGSVRLRETIEGLKRKQAISSQTRTEKENFEKVEIHFRSARTFDQWWQAVCFATETMDFAESSLSLINRDGTKRSLQWRKDGKDYLADNNVRMRLPVRDRRSDSSLRLEVEVCANGSLESAGRRASLFGRLIEEYSIAKLPTETTDDSSELNNITRTTIH